MSEQSRLLEQVEFADGEQRVALVLLLDTSGSMQGEPIDELNRGLRVFKDDLQSDPLASRRVEVAVVTFDSEVRVIQDFVVARDFEPPALTAQGLTYMGAALNKALDMVEARKRKYKEAGVMYYCPWVFMITDGQPEGEPDDVVNQAAWRIREAEEGRHAAVFAVGVENANMDLLRQIVKRDPLPLRGLHFQELFEWLSNSMKQVSRSRPDEQVSLPPVSGWAAVGPGR